MKRILHILPRKPQPLALRYAITAVIVGVCVIVKQAAGHAAEPYGFTLLFPGIVLAAVLFDRGTGAFAVLLSIVFISLTLDWSVNVDEHIAALTVFGIVGIIVMLISEGLRRALEDARQAERAKDILLQELNHRVKNELMMVASVMRMQAKANADPAVARALDAAAARLSVVANAHNHLQAPGQREVIDMRDYLQGVCQNLRDTLQDARPIALQFDVDAVDVPAERGIRLGLITNELVTNSFKYAYPDERGGAIAVRLTALPRGGIELMVEDDGAGCPDDAADGLGSRLVRLLAHEDGGTVSREPRTPGCRVTVTIPR